MAESTTLLDEKHWLDGRTLALEGEIKGLRIPRAELEAALERKGGVTTAAPEEEDSKEEDQRRVTCRRVREVAAAAPDGRDRATLRREQLASDRLEARQDSLANSAGVNEGSRVWLYRPARNRQKSPKNFSDQVRGLQGPAAPYSEDDSGPRRQTGAVPGGYSGPAALRREQCYVLERCLLSDATIQTDGLSARPHNNEIHYCVRNNVTKL
jgi:hypothetical protein